ncbi:MAG: Glucodextranase, domain [Pseudomonadota bacterium]
MTRDRAGAIGLFGFLGAAWLGYAAIFEGFGRTELVVREIGGLVSSESEGRTVTLVAHQEVPPGARVEASEGGRAVLGTEDGAVRLVLTPSAALRVVSVAPDAVALELERGLVQATVHPGGTSLALGAGATRLRVRDAAFEMARDGDDVGAVVRRGTVGVEGVPGLTALTAGERFVRAADDVARAPLSEDLLLAVAPPEEARTRSPEVEVRGRTAPRARVRAGRRGASGATSWVEGRAAPDGTFVVRVPLEEGANRLVVEARDVLGSVAVAEVAVTRDTRAPVVAVEVR